MGMKIAEAAKRTGLSISTIRYYEKSGLCPAIKRGNDGNRRFTATDTDWLSLLASLRTTGMSLSNTRAFAALYALGDETIPQRKAALLNHRQSLEDRQKELDRCREILNRKLNKYDQITKDQA
jgi:DNA-binding transcriptional MerR regulator